nr:MAG TPA: hypothetical protein [Bacteriophage sp.]
MWVNFTHIIGNFITYTLYFSGQYLHILSKQVHLISTP